MVISRQFVKRLWFAVLKYGPAFCIMTAIFMASNTPSKIIPDLGRIDFLVKKGGHLMGYCLLGLCIVRGAGQPVKRTIFWSLVFTFFFAISDEFHQSFVPGRNSSFLDIGIDMSGCGVGLYFYSKNGWLKKIVHLYPNIIKKRGH